MATIECWQPYTPLDQLLSSTLVLTDGEGDVEHVKKELPRSTRRAIKFIRNQKLRPRPGFQRRETWMENQLRLSGDAVYLDLVKTNNHSTLRRESSQSKNSSTENKRRWIHLDLLMDPSIKESSKRLVRTRPSQNVVYRRENVDRAVYSLKEPFEPIPVYEQQIQRMEKRSSRSPRHTNRIKRLGDSDRSKSLEDIDRSETPRDGSKGNNTGVVSKPKNYTEILHYVDDAKSMGAIDSFEPIYVINRKSKEVRECSSDIESLGLDSDQSDVTSQGY
ncbi:hypothetical protein KP79_PYT06974 [Mizuhopecten yessoensis]|uniref:Uncharacterized protein n=1 Tax=Mizuhopecten yessoensis TaxID=6573 RepID=A0A210QJT4_MIZYE|nr:hypothetical protein KP79_PYT06974 [Mizuhopecten yessoensis]